jgi:hypothetical protein
LLAVDEWVELVEEACIQLSTIRYLVVEVGEVELSILKLPLVPDMIPLVLEMGHLEVVAEDLQTRLAALAVTTSSEEFAFGVMSWPMVPNALQGLLIQTSRALLEWQ